MMARAQEVLVINVEELIATLRAVMEAREAAQLSHANRGS